MEITYTIHNNFDHCSVDFNGKKYTYRELKELLKNRTKDYIKQNKVKSKTYSIVNNYSSQKFDKSSLTSEDLEEYLISRKKSKAKSWLSTQRSLRKKGKLKQYHVDMLNKLGMLWNPTKDDWEKSYSFYQKKMLVDILLEMKKKEYSIYYKLDGLIKLNEWENEQRNLFNSDKICNENLIRLNAINFPFKPTLDESNSIKLVTLVGLILRIDQLRKEVSTRGTKAFASRYNLKQKVFVGSPLKIKKTIVLSTYEAENKEYNERMDEYDKSEKKHEEKTLQKEELDKLNAMQITKNKPTDYFLNIIDKISKKYTPTWNDKNIYDANKGSNERLQLLYFDKYYQKYDELERFIDNIFYFPRTTLKKLVYNATWLKYEFDSSIKIYTAKKMLIILDIYLLKTGKLNHKKSFKPISFLIRHYNKENSIEDLVWLKEYISNHQLLTLIYSNRLNKIINKLVK